MVEQQHQMHHQQAASQNGNTSNQNMSTNSSQSHMNYLITAPNANRPQQQRPLPSYVPSSQIQQIIGKIFLLYFFVSIIKCLYYREHPNGRRIL